MEDDPGTPEPVMTAEWWKASVLALLLAVVSVLTAFDTWHPTQDQITAITGAAAVLVAVLFPLIAHFVRNRVTPTEKVALTKRDVELIDAAQGPPLFVSPAKPPGGNPDA